MYRDNLSTGHSHGLSFKMFGRPALAILVFLQLLLGSTSVTAIDGNSVTYYGSLFPTDPSFIRPGIDNGFYYYHASLIKPLSNFEGDTYNFTILSDMEAVGCLYKQSFSPSDPNKNLIQFGRANRADKQPFMSVRLETGNQYVFVVTSYNAGFNGIFTLIINGSSRISLSSYTPSRRGTARDVSTASSSQRSSTPISPSSTMPFLTSTTSSMVLQTTNYSGVLSTNDSTVARPLGSGSNYYYKAIAVTVPTRGQYAMTSSSRIHTFGILYINNFDASNPTQNRIAYDDNTIGNGQFKIIANLGPSTTYILVVTTYLQHDVGDFSITVSGPSRATLRPITDQTASYSDYLSSTSPMFIRPGGSSNYYYYQAIQVVVPIAGMYTFRSQSAMDTYGCLYDNSFDPSYPYSRLICDDDSGGSQQFLFNYYLQPWQIYILVVTTYSPSTTGFYTARGTGPGLLSLTATTRSTSVPLFTTTSCSYFSCESNDPAKYMKIVGIAIAACGLLVILFSIVAYHRMKNTARRQNRRVPPRPSNAPQINTVPGPYIIATPRIHNSYMEQSPPSYDQYIASTKQTDPEDAAHE